MDETVMVLLVGEQPAPNLLPARHYRVSAVLLVYSNLTEHIAENLDKVLQTPTSIKCKVPAYDVSAIIDQLKRIIRDHGWTGRDLVFNLTGGTKLMMLGAFIVAHELGSRWLYMQSEGPASDAHWFGFKDGRPYRAPKETISTTITLTDYLHLHIGEFRSHEPSDDFERAIFKALKPGRQSPVHELLVDIRPTSTRDPEIDMLVRIDNQVGVLEIKKRAAKRGIEQLTTATGRDYLGTYVHKFLVTAHPVSRETCRLAEALRIHVVELPSFAQGGSLSQHDRGQVRRRIAEVMKPRAVTTGVAR